MLMGLLNTKVSIQSVKPSIVKRHYTCKITFSQRSSLATWVFKDYLCKITQDYHVWVCFVRISDDVANLKLLSSMGSTNASLSTWREMK